MNDFTLNTNAAAEKLRAIRIVPVLVLDSVESGMKMCGILSECGLKAAEITFRTAAAAEIIAKASSEFPDLYLGAGTVLNTADLHKAADAGAKFAVAPGFNPAVVKAAVEMAFPFAPGVCTPSEAEQAMGCGCRFLKFFPAEAAGGVKMIRALAAPYKHLGIKFMPTGGITPENAREYLSVPEVAAVGGTWIGKDAGKWDKVEETVRKALELC